MLFSSVNFLNFNFPFFSLSRSPAFIQPRTQDSRTSSSSQHELTDIHTIPEESEDDLMSPSDSPIIFSEFQMDNYHHLAASPDTSSEYLLQEKRDGSSSSEAVSISVMPWRGLLKKANSKVNLNEWTKTIFFSSKYECWTVKNCVAILHLYNTALCITIPFLL